MIRRTIFTTLAIAAMGIGVFAYVSTHPEEQPLPVPSGVQIGELTGLSECEYEPADEDIQYTAVCGTLVIPENWEVPGSPLFCTQVRAFFSCF